MKTFNVTITRTVETHIKVEAKTRLEAYNQIYNYGAIEAASDYPVIEEICFCKIGYIVKVSK